MALEIERKFLLATPPSSWSGEVLAESAVEISQGYLTPLGADPEVRLRKGREVRTDFPEGAVPPSKLGPGGVNMVHKLAVKGSTKDPGRDVLSRHEIEIDLGKERFDEAWPLTIGRRLRKLRVSYVDDRFSSVCIDWFRGCLEGLVLAEIEFDSAELAAKFSPPEYLGKEVTDDPRYRNSTLASATGPPED
jgi:CYTH domain-containing protein